MDFLRMAFRQAGDSAPTASSFQQSGYNPDAVMTLQPGVRLGPYEVVSAIGAGGMGEVYRARDRKLHRDVAVKVLPNGFAQDAQRLARFEREARTLAALNHPNIAAIYGVEEAGGRERPRDGVGRGADTCRSPCARCDPCR